MSRRSSQLQSGAAAGGPPLRSQSGIALVITLVLLSVITVLAIAFLAVSRRERVAVVQKEEGTVTRLMAEAALERAKATLAGSVWQQAMLAVQATNSFTNTFAPLGPELTVSRNYINPRGFVSGSPGLRETNVSYLRGVNGPLLYSSNAANGEVTFNPDLPEMLANMLIDPRPPVFVNTNPPNATVAQRGPPDFRFFLDLDRNGMFNTNGWLQLVNDFGQPMLDAAGNPWTNWFVGDPEWIGQLQFPATRENPYAFHHRTNRFVGRYAYIILPAGRALDINFIHNQLKNVPLNVSGYHRNQGFGSWEINLAALLADLNTNAWARPVAGDPFGYDYSLASGYSMTPPLAVSFGTLNRGRSFEDARELYRLRYFDGSLFSVPRARDVFGRDPRLPPPNDELALSLASDFIDSYGDSRDLPLYAADLVDDDTDINRPWPGGSSYRHFFGVQDYFDPAKTNELPGFHARLNRAVRGQYSQSSYDKYTYYDMLNQLGADSVPEEPPAVTRPIARATSSGDVKVIDAPLHGFYSGDWVTIRLANGNSLGPFRITVTSSNTFSYFDMAPPPPPPPVGATNYAVDPFAQAKININYDNINFIGRNDLPRFPSATNFVPWSPTNFFIAAADRLLRQEFRFGVNEIPVYLGTNTVQNGSLGHRTIGTAYYSPRVHQLLQIAANIYDATIGSKNLDAGLPAESAPFYPTVYRPVFELRNGPSLFITNYVEVTPQEATRIKSDMKSMPPRWFDLEDVVNPGSPRYAAAITELNSGRLNVYGIPLIIAARKGIPNLNKVVVQTGFQFTRVLNFEKRQTNETPYLTNLQLRAAIPQEFLIEAWNSYTNLPGFNGYPRPLEMVVSHETDFNLLINGRPSAFHSVARRSHSTNLIIAPETWGGLRFTNPPVRTDWVLFDATITPAGFVTNRILSTNLSAFEPLHSGWGTNRWSLLVTNRLLYSLFDERDGRLVDCVSLSGMNYEIDVSQQLAGSRQWDTTPQSRWTTFGIYNQFEDSINGNPLLDEFVRGPSGRSPTLRMQARDAVSELLTGSFEWLVNDPLVHYTLADCAAPPKVQTWGATVTPISPNNYPHAVVTKFPLGTVTSTFDPWGGANGSDNGQFLPLKDPFPVGTDPNWRVGVASDYWDFPTNAVNKFANVGWLGRVHRGTPWQTISLKPARSEADEAATFAQWTGPLRRTFETYPTNDWKLIDLFTVAQHPNATRGRLSINQSGKAGWSAVLSGLQVATLEDLGDGNFGRGVTNLEPAYYAGVPSPRYNPNVQLIFDGIDRQRRNRLKAPYQFARLSELLAVRELTTRAPYLLPDGDIHTSFLNPLRDSDYEMLPQKILSLLKVGEPRFVVYAYGQSLKPAPNSIVQSGPHFGLCQNYQITGEMALRAVVRVEPQRDANTGWFDWSRPPRTVIESFNILPPD